MTAAFIRAGAWPLAAARRRLAAVALLWASAMALSAALAGAAAAQGRAAQVEVARVEMRALGDRVPLIGRVKARARSDIAARVGGVVDAVLVEVGDRVEAGGVLARLDREALDLARRAAAAALAEAEAGVSAAEAQLGLARQVAARAGRLRGSTAFSRGQFEDANAEAAVAASAVARAEASRAAAQAALARADYDLGHADIRAPFGGVVLARSAERGQYLALGATVATLLDPQALEIEVDAPNDVVAGLTPGVEARFEAGAAEGVAQVRAVLPIEDPATRTRPVRLAADLARWPQLAAPGAAVTVYAPAGAPREATTAPKDALVQAAGGWMVFVAEDGAARPQPVTIGVSAGDRVEILSGVAPGALVVVRGNERLRPGQPIAFETPAE